MSSGAPLEAEAVGRPSAVRVPALDGIRGLAILPVLLTHFVNNGVMTPLSAADDFVSYVLGFGWVGVDLFFVLSGFLITGILIDSKGGPHYFRNFYIRRVASITASATFGRSASPDNVLVGIS